MADDTVMTPHRTEKPTERDVTGKFVGFLREGVPILLNMPESKASYLPCFSEERALYDLMKRIGVEVTKVQIIEDSKEFLLSVPMKCPTGEPLYVIVDPWFTPEGRVRFTMLLRD